MTSERMKRRTMLGTGKPRFLVHSNPAREENHIIGARPSPMRTFNSSLRLPHPHVPDEVSTHLSSSFNTLRVDGSMKLSSGCANSLEVVSFSSTGGKKTTSPSK